MAISGGDGSIILTTNVDQTGLKKGLGSMEKTAKSSSAKIAKSFAVIGAAAATATVAITKMAVDAYADYEQLVGGVETLFKGSAQKVIDYANDAFYTAGKNANEYLDLTITFANSLIQGLGGDTERAADLANMAIVDMSDNVNRLGSDVQMVEYAYRGLARQEYRMLDNLKLGYQGTAAEMARLINDSKVMGEGFVATAENVRSISFDKYIEAIHEIQVQLGIAGTTSYEAAATIQGSAKMMKAAWQNVLSAIAGGGDIDRAINNLVYSIQKYFENIGPVVERSLMGIGQLIEKVAPMLVQNVASALIKSIPSLINAIYQMIIGLAKGIQEGIEALFKGGSGDIKAQIKTSVNDNFSNSNLISSGETNEDYGTVDSGAGNKIIDDEIKAIEKKIKALQKENKQIQKNDKANRKANEKQLASFDDISILSSNQISEADAMIEKNNEEIDQLMEQIDLLREKKEALQGVNSESNNTINVGTQAPVANTEMSITPGEQSQSTIFDGILEKLIEIKELFSSGFWIGFQNADFKPLSKSLGDVEKSLKNIFTDNNVIKSAENFGTTIIESLGKIAGGTTSIGVTYATNLIGGFNMYLSQESETIKNSIISIFDASSEIAQKASDIWVSFSNILMAFSSTDGQKITANIISIFANSGLTVGTIATKLGADFISLLSTAITENETELKTTLENVLKDINGLLTPLTTLITKTMEKVNKAYDRSISPLFDSLGSGISELVVSITSAYNDDIHPVLQELGKEFEDVVENHISPAVDSFIQLIESIVGFIKVLWEKWLKPLIDWMIKTFSPVFADALKVAGILANDFLTAISTVFESVMNIFNGFVIFLTGVFSGDMGKAWEGITQIWDGAIGYFEGVWTGIKDVFSTVSTFFEETFSNAWQKVVDVFSVGGEIFVDIKDGVYSVFKTVVNQLIEGINKVVKKPFETINDVLEEIQEIEVAGVQPFKWLSTRISIPKIPKLATGAVLPPNKPFLSIVGDQKHGTNIEAPLDTIVEAMNIALDAGNSKNENTEIVLEMNGREFGRAAIDLAKRESRIRGTRLVFT